MQQSWNGILTAEQGARLRTLREQREVSLNEVVNFLNADSKHVVTEQQLEAIEQNGGPIDATTLFQLSTLYDTSLHFIFHGNPYSTPGEYIEAYLAELITEGFLADGLNTDIVDARMQVERYQMNLDTAKREVCKP